MTVGLVQITLRDILIMPFNRFSDREVKGKERGRKEMTRQKKGERKYR